MSAEPERGSGSTDPLQEAVTLLASEHATERDRGWDAVGALCNGKPQHVARVWQAIKMEYAGEDDDLVIESAVYALGSMAANDRDRIVVTAARQWVLSQAASPESNIRLAVARELPWFRSEPDDPRVDATLVALTRDEDDEVRNWATFGLAQATAVSSLPAVHAALLERVADTHAETRNEALLGLARRGDESAKGAVAVELKNGARWSHCVEAAGLLGDDDFLPLLRDLLPWWDNDPELLRRAIRRCDPVQRAEAEAALARTVALVRDAFGRADIAEVEVCVEADSAMGCDLHIAWVDAAGVRREGWYGFESVMQRDDVQGDPERAARHMVVGLMG
jgi:hypothetical protein